MSFTAPYQYAKYLHNYKFKKVVQQKNNNHESNKIVQQAKNAIGNKVTSKETIPHEKLKAISNAIKKIDKYKCEKKLKELPISLVFLKAQLFHKKHQIKQAKCCYQKIINNNKTTIENKLIRAKICIAMANITNHRSQLAKETKIEGEKHSPRNKTFTQYIKDAIKLLPKKEIIKIMEQYCWLNQKQEKLAYKMLQKSKKKKDKTILKKVKPI